MDIDKEQGVTADGYKGFFLFWSNENVLELYPKMHEAYTLKCKFHGM